MKRNRERTLGVILIIIALVIAAVSLYRGYAKETVAHESAVKVSEQEKAAVTQGGEEQEEADFELRNVTDEELEFFGVDRQELIELLKTWLEKNKEYGNTVGVEFYDENEIMDDGEKRSIMMKTIIGNDGWEEESRILVLDYYKAANRYNIHP